MAAPGTTTKPSAHRENTKVALAAVVGSFIVLDCLGSWLLPDNTIEIVATLAYTILVFQSIVFGVWTALGAGSIIARFVLAVPCLLLVLVAPESYQLHSRERVSPNFLSLSPQVLESICHRRLFYYYSVGYQASEFNRALPSRAKVLPSTSVSSRYLS